MREVSRLAAGLMARLVSPTSRATTQGWITRTLDLLPVPRPKEAIKAVAHYTGIGYRAIKPSMQERKYRYDTWAPNTPPNATDNLHLSFASLAPLPLPRGTVLFEGQGFPTACQISRLVIAAARPMMIDSLQWMLGFERATERCARALKQALIGKIVNVHSVTSSSLNAEIANRFTPPLSAEDDEDDNDDKDAGFGSSLVAISTLVCYTVDSDALRGLPVFLSPWCLSPFANEEEVIIQGGSTVTIDAVELIRDNDLLLALVQARIRPMS
jgi:hypothetical protein